MQDGVMTSITLYNLYRSFAGQAQYLTSQVRSLIEYSTPTDNIIVLIRYFNLTKKITYNWQVLVRFNNIRGGADFLWTTRYTADRAARIRLRFRLCASFQRVHGRRRFFGHFNRWYRSMIWRCGALTCAECRSLFLFDARLAVDDVDDVHFRHRTISN